MGFFHGGGFDGGLDGADSGGFAGGGVFDDFEGVGRCHFDWWELGGGI